MPFIIVAAKKEKVRKKIVGGLVGFFFLGVFLCYVVLCVRILIHSQEEKEEFFIVVDLIIYFHILC